MDETLVVKWSGTIEREAARAQEVRAPEPGTRRHVSTSQIVALAMQAGGAWTVRELAAVTGLLPQALQVALTSLRRSGRVRRVDRPVPHRLMVPAHYTWIGDA